MVVSRRIRCTSPRDALWLALADTRRFSRALGGRPVVAVKLDDAGAARYLSTTRVSGLEISYEERPFDWSRPEHLHIQRRIRSGPAARYALSLRLGALDEGGTEVALRLEVEPRSLALWPLVRAQAALVSGKMMRLLRRMDENLARGVEAYGQEAAARIDPGALERALGRLATLAGDEAALARRLCEHVARAPDLEVERLRPFALADQWGIERRRLLGLCLHAVAAGLLEVSWEVLCPSCRLAAAQARQLVDLAQAAHCHLCDLTIGVDLARSVEVVARPAPAIRKVEAGPYCISGPFTMPHVVAQAVLPAGGEVTIRAPTLAGRYRLSVRGGATSSLEVTGEGAAHAAVACGAALEPRELHLAPAAELRLADGLDQERHLRIEHLAWASQAATAHEVSLLPAFRRLFSHEVLRPGLALAVGRVSILFTDLAGSTELYARLGDAAAFAFVQEHFVLTTAIVEQHEGCVVKTLGDSVMAVFSDEARALAAAIALQRAHTAQPGADARPALKIGLFSGPCYAVTANRQLDYFGQTVNVAQRLEAAAAGGEIVLPAELVTQGAPWLDGALVTEEATVALKGVPTPMRLARVRLAGAPARVRALTS